MTIIESFISMLHRHAVVLPDSRKGNPVKYSMLDVFMSAFSLFHMQSGSFLQYQENLKQKSRRSNCETLYGMQGIPSDNHIRNLLDPIEVSDLDGMFKDSFEEIKKSEALKKFNCLEDHSLIALDGTEFYSSYNIHNMSCSHRTVTVKKKKTDKKAEKEDIESGYEEKRQYFQSFVAAAFVAPNVSNVLPLFPEFITQQDGHDKQDCERAAVKRWIEKNNDVYSDFNPVYLGDDIYCCNPIVSLIKEKKADFIFTCKKSSHKFLYDFIDGAEHDKIIRSHGERKKKCLVEYSWVNDVPICDGKGVSHVNWVSARFLNKDGSTRITFSFATSISVTKKNIEEIIECGRARWKKENEGFNVLKNHGYNIDRNFGHGKKNLSMIMVCINLLAFLTHSLADLTSPEWQKARKYERTREGFFRTLLSLTRYFLFETWQDLLISVITSEPPGQNNLRKHNA